MRRAAYADLLFAELLNRRVDRLRVLTCVSCLFILLASIGILISEFRFSLDDEYRLVNASVMFCTAS